MKITFIILWFSVIIFSCNKNHVNKLDKITTEENLTKSVEQTGITENTDNIPEGLNKLLKAYPDFINNVDENYLYLRNGEKIIWDDGKKKTFDEMLEDPDLEDMMSIPYPKGNSMNFPPEKNFDPGRIRHEGFFKSVYGNNENEVRDNCVVIDWFGTSVLVTKINGVDKKLEEVKKELQQLPSDFHKYFNKTGGTLNWRYIKNTERLSTHSFATALDINTDFADYWEWSKNLEYKNRIPMEVVEIFEKYKFIWGGKWFHYDTMHFEYRPELF